MNTPIKVNASIPATMIPVALRQVILIVGGAVTLSALVGERDWMGVLDYLQSEPFLLVVASLVTLWATVQGQRVSLQNTADKAAMEPFVPNDVAVRVETTPPPAVDDAL